MARTTNVVLFLTEGDVRQLFDQQADAVLQQWRALLGSSDVTGAQVYQAACGLVETGSFRQSPQLIFDNAPDPIVVTYQVGQGRIGAERRIVALGVPRAVFRENGLMQLAGIEFYQPLDNVVLPSNFQLSQLVDGGMGTDFLETMMSESGAGPGNDNTNEEQPDAVWSELNLTPPTDPASGQPLQLQPQSPLVAMVLGQGGTNIPTLATQRQLHPGAYSQLPLPHGGFASESGNVTGAVPPDPWNPLMAPWDMFWNALNQPELAGSRLGRWLRSRWQRDPSIHLRNAIIACVLMYGADSVAELLSQVSLVSVSSTRVNPVEGVTQTATDFMTALYNAATGLSASVSLAPGTEEALRDAGDAGSALMEAVGSTVNTVAGAVGDIGATMTGRHDRYLPSVLPVYSVFGTPQLAVLCFEVFTYAMCAYFMLSMVGFVWQGGRRVGRRMRGEVDWRGRPLLMEMPEMPVGQPDLEYGDGGFDNHQLRGNSQDEIATVTVQEGFETPGEQTHLLAQPVAPLPRERRDGGGRFLTSCWAALCRDGGDEAGDNVLEHTEPRARQNTRHATPGTLALDRRFTRREALFANTGNQGGGNNSFFTGDSVNIDTENNMVMDNNMESAGEVHTRGTALNFSSSDSE